MGLELLPLSIALALQGLAIGRVDPGKRGQHRLDPLHGGKVSGKVAGLAGAEIGIAIVVGDGRRAAPGLDQRDQIGRQIGGYESPVLEHGGLGGRHPLHGAHCAEPLGDGIGGGRHGAAR